MEYSNYMQEAYGEKKSKWSGLTNIVLVTTNHAHLHIQHDPDVPTMTLRH